MTGPRAIDVRHLGRERVICCFAQDGVLVDPGPGSCVETLVEALGDEVPQALLLTHIHLDHAGAAGTLARRWPQLDVYVHERGARHLADPERLLASATRLYGDDMERLWGEFAPVPAERLRPLAGGETVRGFRVAYAPGHASHHVAYLHEASGVAFTGDVAGVRVPPSARVVAPTPPPDIDLELWRGSLATLRSWRPTQLALTHFGAVGDPAPHLDELEAELDRLEQLDPERGREAFLRDHAARLAAAADRATVAAYEQAVPPDQLWLGLERYLVRRDEGRQASSA